MIAISKIKLRTLQNHLTGRYQDLFDELNGIALINSKDCITKRDSYWNDYTELAKIDKDKINLAINDLKSILSEISKLK
jgi:hypothetical protein